MWDKQTFTDFCKFNRGFQAGQKGEEVKGDVKKVQEEEMDEEPSGATWSHLGSKGSKAHI